jgi:tetratricopeptide (TPR) repeat protein
MSIEEEEKRSRVLSRYTADYSKWEQWAPDDDATKAEEEEKRKAEDDRLNKEFEKNNPDFCKQFMSDMEERKKASQKKQESADILRLKGNRYFKTKDFDKALELYMDALKNAPFDCKLLLNIAQVRLLSNIFIHFMHNTDLYKQ